ncbi:MAG TPA: cytochrome c [Lacipirellulaceae bacterium]|nr:cytochrome c [Lacipirellulaceae bacterium]
MTYVRSIRNHVRWLIAALALALLAASGCQQKMADQPSFKPLQPCDFFPDGRSERPVVPYTIARGHLRSDVAFFTGRIAGPRIEAATATGNKIAPVSAPPAAQSPLPPVTNIVPPGFSDDAAFVREFPVPVTEAMIRHGYNRYMIYCVVCHDPLGTGHGRIIERGYTPPPSYHIDRLRNTPVGRIFAIITEGYGSMPSYANQIPPEDRWAIVAYVRALQLSQHFPKTELTPDMLKDFSKSMATSATNSNITSKPGEPAQ